jgi:hypothetical protein
VKLVEIILGKQETFLVFKGNSVGEVRHGPRKPSMFISPGLEGHPAQLGGKRRGSHETRTVNWQFLQIGVGDSVGESAQLAALELWHARSRYCTYMLYSTHVHTYTNMDMSAPDQH